MKKMTKSVLACGLLACMAVSLSACGNSDGRTTLDFQFTGESAVQAVFWDCIDAYNDTQGKEDNIKIRGLNVPDKDNKEKLRSVMSSSSGPDVAVANDRYFKLYINNYLDITDLVSQSVTNGLYPSQEIRYHYNSEKTTSNKTDPLYGLPVYNDPTVLFYNKTAIENTGIICISVDETELDAFNAGAKDHNGKTKKDYGIPDSVTVVNKGFYRTKPYVPNEGERDGSVWKKPAAGELMIFNEKIACNWDEIEDLGLVCTSVKNAAAKTTYGYYTEWWFNYGWSVGGDCLEDLDGNGDWVYSHADETPNYIVKDGQTYVGAYTGTEYTAGETLDIKDILNAGKTDKISYNTENGKTFYYTVNGNRATIRAQVEDEAEKTDGKLQELPSIYDAFSRFCFLSAKGGLGVCPSPAVFNNTPSSSYFAQGELALLVEQYSKADTFNKRCKFDWGVAKMPQYKTYTDPENPDCDEVAAVGTSASHSEGYSVVIRKNTEYQAEAIKFIEWLTTEGQKIFAKKGFGSVCKADAQLVGEKITEIFKINNAEAITTSLNRAQAGDWWYLRDDAWIDIWSIPLNTKVRKGIMTFDQYIYAYIEQTNTKLLNY
ncbi:MAG: extracellular solute-binding protein, partial [Clostridia bacterium]|nr:extracellular solute-binding protein [Clostridia bacterium]